MELRPLCLMLSGIRVTPDRPQFFMYEPITLSCEHQNNSTGWKVKRKTEEAGVRPCSSGWGFASSGSVCFIRNAYPSDTGVYWCESAEREHSDAINVTITDSVVVLVSPALPVSEGATVILRCKSDNVNSSETVYNFYKDGRLVGSSPKGEMAISSVSKSDEGLYKCCNSRGNISINSWFAVRASRPPPPPPPPSPSPSPPAASCSVSVFRMLWHIAVGTPYLLSTVLLGLIYRDARTRAAAQADTKRRGSRDVIMEIVV